MRFAVFFEQVINGFGHERLDGGFLGGGHHLDLLEHRRIEIPGQRLLALAVRELSADPSRTRLARV